MTIVALVLAFLTLVLINLQKTYSHLPLKELKRRAQNGDTVATTLYTAAAFENGLHTFLWGLVGLSSAGFMLIVSRLWPAWGAFLAILGLFLIGFGWVPRRHPSTISLKITSWLTPAIVRVLGYIHPIVNFLDRLVGVHEEPSKKARLYEKEDLMLLLSAQKEAGHNRIPQPALDIAAHALSFGDKNVREFMTPRRNARLVLADETIGPILIDELHKTGLANFPVVDGPDGEVIGTLFLSELIKLPEGGQAKDVMSSKVYYVHEDQSLDSVLNAFLNSKHPVFVVVNNHEEIVGTINIEDVLGQIMSRNITDDFDQYDDRRAVAAWGIANQHKKEAPPETVEEQVDIDEEIEPEAEEITDEVPAEEVETETVEDVDEDKKEEEAETEEAEELKPEPEETNEPIEPKRTKSKKSKIKEEDIDDTIELE